MLRTSMGAQTLVDCFKIAKKEVTKDNAHVLCAFACKNHELFLSAAAPGYLAQLMAIDTAYVYSYTRGYKMWNTYYKLAEATCKQYGVEVLTDEHAVKELFDALDTKIQEIQSCLEKDGFPQLQ